MVVVYERTGMWMENEYTNFTIVAWQIDGVEK